jgi:glycosyltransferase involved in cell wall biosynthesis
MKSVSLVIRAFNKSAYLGRLLDGVSRQTLRNVEVILVDSGSTDSTVELAAAAGAQIVRIPPAEFTFGRSLSMTSPACLLQASPAMCGMP